MTDNPNATIDEISTTATNASKRALREFMRHYTGWLIFGVLLIASIIGLIITFSSVPLQIDAPTRFDKTVPRKVVPIPGVQSAITPPAMSYAVPVLPSVQIASIATPVPAKPVASPLITKSVAAPEIAIKLPPVKATADHHAAHFKQPVIAIVIDDMGLDRKHSLQAINLPAPVTLAFMPYAQQVNAQTDAARQNGHELIVHMPMEPDDLAHNNPGPNALLLKNGEAENVHRLEQNLAAFTGYIGINNHMGSALTANRTAITPVLQDLKSRGLWFLDSKTDAHSVAANIADEIGLPFASRDVFLDNVNDKNAVLAQLRETENIARRKGYAVAIGHPKSGTIAALQDWTRDVESRGIALVPLSSVIAARFPNAAVPRYAQTGNMRLVQK